MRPSRHCRRFHHRLAAARHRARARAEPVAAPGQLPPPAASAVSRSSAAQAAPPPAAAAAAKPYKAVAISAPAPVTDPSFEAFRKQSAPSPRRRTARRWPAGVAELLLDGREGRQGRQEEARHRKSRQGDPARRQGRLRAGTRSRRFAPIRPARRFRTARTRSARRPIRRSTARSSRRSPKSTGTDEGDWAYPTQPGLEVHGGAQPNAPVVEKLGMHFVRVHGGRRAGANQREPDDPGGRAVRQDRLRAGRRASARSATTSSATARKAAAGRSRASSAAISNRRSV